MYFKITNREENHHGFQYKTGLNMLEDDFVTEGSCVAGGLYFTNEKFILEYLHFGIYIREVYLPTDHPDFLMAIDRSGDKWRSNMIILGEKRLLSNVKTFEYLIEKKVDIHADSDYALRWAATNDYFGIVELLLKNHADVSSENNAAIRLASANGQLNIVKLLLSKGADLHAKNDYSFRWACRNGHLTTAKFLIEHGTKINSKSDYALIWAITNDHYEIIKLLLRNGANVHTNNEYPLKMTFIHNRYKTFNLLIKYGANIDALLKGKKFSYNISNEPNIPYGIPIRSTTHDSLCTNQKRSFNKYADLCDYLVENIKQTENFFMNNDGDLEKNFIKCWAEINNCEKILSLCQGKCNADFNLKIFLLNKSSRYGYILLVKLLIKTMNVQSDKNDYALRWSCRLGRIEIVRLLLLAGANVHSNNEYCLRWASRKGNAEMVELLIIAGADIHINNDKLLQLAARNGRLEIVRMLIKSGCNCHSNDNYAIKWATKNKHQDVIDLLIENGAIV